MAWSSLPVRWRTWVRTLASTAKTWWALPLHRFKPMAIEQRTPFWCPAKSFNGFLKPANRSSFRHHRTANSLFTKRGVCKKRCSAGDTKKKEELTSRGCPTRRS
eukprot:706519-Rhodomonas_salina.1